MKNKNCSSCLHQAEFPEGMWVEKIGNILEHASASQHAADVRSNKI